MNYKELAAANTTYSLEDSLKLPKKVQAARLRVSADLVEKNSTNTEASLGRYVLRQVARLLEHGGSLEHLQKGLIL